MLQFLLTVHIHVWCSESQVTLSECDTKCAIAQAELYFLYRALRSWVN